jgi:beta-galactosidase
VKYEPGKIEVVAYDQHGAEAERKVVRTAGKPAAIRLSAEEEGLLTMYTVTITDPQGNRCPHSTNRVRIRISGAGTLAGIANGDPTCLTPLGEHEMPVFGGQLTFFVRRTDTTAPVTVTVSSKGLVTAKTTKKS